MTVGVLVIVASTLFSCSTGPKVKSTSIIVPTLQTPAPMCYITCPQGYMSRQHHLCHSGMSRYFEDITVIGENNNPNSPSDSRWFTTEAAYLKIDVERGTCRSIIAQIIAGRSFSERDAGSSVDPLTIGPKQK